MIIPAASFIEMANDSLKRIDDHHLEQQRKELHTACGDVSSDFIKGYELGLQTGRIIIGGNKNAVQAKVTF